jgi:hypothetical protein
MEAMGMLPEEYEAEPKPMKGLRILRWPIAIALVLGIVLGAVIPRAFHHSPPLTKSQASAVAGALGLTLGELPSGWLSVPGASPIAALTGSGGSGAPSDSQRRQNQAIVAHFQACIGLSNARDRTFGAAGILPLVQVPSPSFFSRASIHAYEAGTATQYYTDPSNVAKDQAQMAILNYPVCLDQAIARMFVLGTVNNPATLAVPAHSVAIHAGEGVFVRSATAKLSIPNGSTKIPLWIGVTLIIQGHIEQSLYTYSPIGPFPTSETQHIVDQLVKQIQAGPVSSLA